MSASLELQGSQVGEPPAAKPLDDGIWRAWVAKSHARERQDAARRFQLVKLFSIAMLIAAASLWSSLGAFDVVIRFLVAIGAVATMSQALSARHHAVAVMFAVLALLYNPVIPVFGFLGDWQRVLVAASSIPFIISLASSGARTKQTN